MNSDSEKIREELVPIFATSMDSVKERIQQLQQFVKQYMKEGEDYGIIPGCGDKKCLLKPGAEKLCDIYGFSKEVIIITKTEDFNGKLFPDGTELEKIVWKNRTKVKERVKIKVRAYFDYEVKVRLVNKRTGFVEAEGVGNCNTLEAKYATADPFTMKNTVLKMAKKRALVDATLSATRSSGLFTQDIEDLLRIDARVVEDIPETVSEAQRKRLYTLADGDHTLIKQACEKYNYESSRDIQKSDYEKICDEITSVTNLKKEA